MSGEDPERPGERPREPAAPATPPLYTARAPAPAPRAQAPAGPRSCLGSLVALLGVVVGALYMANFTMGFDFPPDNLPLVGNIDEAAATTMLVLGLQYLFGKRRRD